MTESGEGVDEDFVLLERWREGDRDAGESLFARYFPLVSRFFRNKLAYEHEDLIQTTFLACVEAKGRIGATSFRAYLFTVARRRLYEHLRGRGHPIRDAAPMTSSMAGDWTSPSAAVARTQAEAQVLRALRGLPVDDQIVLELRFWEQLSTAELADVLEVPGPTARTRLRRARLRLATLFGDEGDLSPSQCDRVRDCRP